MDTKIVEKFEVRMELNGISPEDKPLLMVSFYNNHGKYIGDHDNFKKLVIDRGILPEVYRSRNNVCSIGKSEKDGKWYGWSHRAIFGFKIGDAVKEGDCCASSGYTEEYLKEHGPDEFVLPVGFIAKTEADTKKMAIAFAASVS